MHRLLLELQSHIFELVLPTRGEQGRGAIAEGPPGKMPPYLTSIRKGWRDIAWSIPWLWSTIQILLGTALCPIMIRWAMNTEPTTIRVFVFDRDAHG